MKIPLRIWLIWGGGECLSLPELWSSYRYYLHATGSSLLKSHVILDYFSGDIWEKRWKYQQFVEEMDGAGAGRREYSMIVMRSLRHPPSHSTNFGE